MAKTSIRWGIGDVIRRLRLENDWTQQELADLAGVVRPTISDAENGKTEPDLRTLKAIADVFSLTLDGLLRLIPHTVGEVF